MKQLLSFFCAVLVAITALGQTSPPNKLRSNDSFTQVDNYLVAAKRLGIPSGPTPTLNGSTTPENSSKLFYATDDNTLYVYDPVGEDWNPVSSDVDLSNYWTIAQVDSAITASSAFNLLDVTQLMYVNKAINVRAFNNTGIAYSEGSIDFGISRDSLYSMGPYAFKQGFETTASGVVSSAFGNYTKATGDVSAAFGEKTVASGDRSSAFGMLSLASGNYSSAFGFQSTASGESSSAFGLLTEASGDYSSAFGNYSKASGVSSSAFGYETTANEYASFAIGAFSTDGLIETAWTPGSPIFKVGNGSSSENKSNAYVLNNDGTSTQYGIASYGADYSANFTDRSLVDKGYVDSLTGFGLSYNSITGKFDWGETTTINIGPGQDILYHTVPFGDNELLFFGNIDVETMGDNGTLTYSGYNSYDSDFDIVQTGRIGDKQARIQLQGIPDQTGVMILADGDNSHTLINASTVNSGEIRVEADGSILLKNTSSPSAPGYLIDNTGLKALADYSANFTDRSLVDKEYVDEQNAFNLEDVTQILYTDKAINVKAFNNTGMSYSEGSIDFGITRASTHTMGLYAFKQGVETTASGPGSSAFGSETTASGNSSSAFGSGTTASGEASSAFGNGTTASGLASSALGYQSIANEYASLAIGRYSTVGPVETSWTTGSPIFKVGNGSNGNRSNAYVLYNDGRSEQQKDIEVTEIGQGVVLKSPDGTRWRITVDNSGNLSATSL